MLWRKGHVVYQDDKQLLLEDILKMKHIPIVVISDNRQAFAVATTFINLLEVKKTDTFYDLYAVVSPDFGAENKAKIESIQKDYEGCAIHFIDADNRFDNIQNKTSYISNACAYKFCLAEFLPKLDKVLYLDTDIVVFDDLTALYNIDIKDNYIGGVFSFIHLLQDGLRERLGVADMLSYVNAGVLLFNLKQIRKNGIINQCLNLVGSYDDSVDQHIYNKICYGHIALISPKYNVTHSNEQFYKQEIALTAFTQKELSETQNPVIYHYTGPNKPWNAAGLKYGLIWLGYCKKSPYRDLVFKQNKKLNLFCPFADTKIEYSFLERLFSVKTRYKNGFPIKVLTVLGCRFTQKYK